jgi:hypothetical protein
VTISPTNTSAERALPSPADQHDLGSTDASIEPMMRWFREPGDIYRLFAAGPRHCIGENLLRSAQDLYMRVEKR